MTRSPRAVVQNRPAESSAGAAAAVVVVIVYLAHITDPGVTAALVLLVGFLPSAITWAVNLVRGRRATT